MQTTSSLVLIPIGNCYLGMKCPKGRGYICPGGKIEPGETALEAAVRETEEEIGLICEPKHLKLIDEQFNRSVFLYSGPLNFSSSYESRPVIITKDDLLKSKFGDRYKKLFESHDL